MPGREEAIHALKLYISIYSVWTSTNAQNHVVKKPFEGKFLYSSGENFSYKLWK